MQELRLEQLSKTVELVLPLLSIMKRWLPMHVTKPSLQPSALIKQRLWRR